MSNKFGEFYYYPSIDKDGFDILTGMGDDCKILSWEPSQPLAALECLRRYVADIESRYARLEEVLRLIADNKADEWIDRRSKYTRWMAEYGSKEIMRQVAGLVLRDIRQPDATDFWMKPKEESEG